VGFNVQVHAALHMRHLAMASSNQNMERKEVGQSSTQHVDVQHIEDVAATETDTVSPLRCNL
jgi:hypothetical protein